MTYVKTYLPTLKTHVVNLKREAKDLSRDLQRLAVRGKLGSKTLYYVAVSASRQGEANPSLIGYPSGQDGLILPGFTSLVPQKSSVLSHIINPLLTKLVRSGWLNIGLVLYCFFTDLDFVFFNKNSKKNLAKNAYVFRKSRTRSRPRLRI